MDNHNCQPEAENPFFEGEPEPNLEKQIKNLKEAIKEAILYIDKYHNYTTALGILQKVLEGKDG